MYPSAALVAATQPTILTGAGRRIRTDDLLITNQLLYQLSYAGMSLRKIAVNRSSASAFLYANVHPGRR
jgi:hypothetical protein